MAHSQRHNRGTQSSPRTKNLPSSWLNPRRRWQTLQNCLLTARDHKDLDNENFNPLLMQIEKINSKIQGLKGSLMRA